MKKLLLTLLLAVVSSSVMATNWALVGGIDIASVYVAVDSTRYTGNKALHNQIRTIGTIVTSQKVIIHMSKNARTAGRK